jgi:hypothetical protein
MWAVQGCDLMPIDLKLKIMQTEKCVYMFYNYYHPNIKSDTWPNMPFPGDCPAGIALDEPTLEGALCVATTRLCVGDWPGFRKAAADGANLIGVPYEGVFVCVWAGGTSSTTIEFGDVGSTVALDTNPRPAVV